MNNIDISQLLTSLSKMDKKDLQEGLLKASELLNANDKEKIINELKKK